MQKYQNNVTNRDGSAAAGMSVVVNISGGAPATIYSDNGVTAIDNPLTTDANGYFQFYAADGRYDIVVIGAGGYTDVLISDTVELSADAARKSELAAADGVELIGYENRTVGDRLVEMPSPTDGPYLANPNGVAVNTTALNNFLANNVEGEFPPGAYKSGEFSTNAGRSLRTRTFGKTRSGKTVIRLDGDHDRLFWYANLNTSGAGDSRHMSWDGFLFDGDGHSIADALHAVEGAYQVRYHDCGFVNSMGRVMRFRQTNEVSFSACLWADNDCSASEMIYFDQVGLDAGGNPFANFNVNNVTFDDNCHFEGNKGTYFRAHPNANLDILRFLGAKFEYGALAAGSAGWTLFDMVNCFRFFMGAGTTFTNFRAENNFAKIFKFSSAAGELCQGGLIEATHFRGISGTTVLLDKGVGDNTRLGRGVGYQSTDGNKPLIINTSKYQDNSDDWRNDNGNDAGSASKDTARLRSISSHDTAFPGAGTFVVDAGTRNLQGTALKVTGDAKVLADFPLPWASGRPNAFRLAVRARTAAGTGQIRAQIGTTLLTAQTVTAAYGTYYFDVNAADVAALGASGSDRLRVSTVGADDYFFDQAYLLDHPGAAARIPEAFFKQAVALNTPTQMPLPAAVAPNGRGVFVFGVSQSADTGFSVIVEVNGGKLALLSAAAAHVVVGTADLVAANKYNLFLTGNVLTVTHRYTDDGTARVVSLYPLPF